MSTTMLETYDAPMLDYQNDADVAMHPSSDPWMNEEPMEDETFTEDTTVEVEMEAFQEEVLEEYEMTDEAAPYSSEAVDMHDVEVEDANLTQLYAAPIPLESSAIVPEFEPSASLPSVSPEFPVVPQFELPIPVAVDESTFTSTPLATESPLVTSAIQVSHSDEATDPLEDQATAPSEPVENLHHHIVEDSLGDNVDLNLPEPVSGHSDVTEDVSAAAYHAESAAQPLSDSTLRPELVASEDAAHDPIALEVPEAADISLADPSAATTSVLEREGSGDPHEISEGVYIDPPPPVLVSLSSPIVAEVFLFNHPSSRSGTPSSPTGEPASPSSPVLLQHHPTLYYEPIATVFEALRQEQLVATLGEGELALDAYDLQLSISEDNYHSREVTLHDLNAIHDGSDLSGPLRLRLYTILPRFITRYHQLQDQVSRLHLSRESGDSSEALTVTVKESLQPSDLVQGESPDQLPVDYQPEVREDEPEHDDHPEEPSHNESSSHAESINAIGEPQTDHNNDEDDAPEDVAYPELPDDDDENNEQPEAQLDEESIHHSTDIEAGSSAAVELEAEATDIDDIAEPQEDYEEYPELPDDEEDIQQLLVESGEYVESNEPAEEGHSPLNPITIAPEELASDVVDESIEHRDIEHHESNLPLDETSTDPNITSTLEGDEVSEAPLQNNTDELELAETDDFGEWDHELDAEGEVDTTWDDQETLSIESSTTTISSKNSMKRSHDEVELETNELDLDQSLLESPSSKRTRTL